MRIIAGRHRGRRLVAPKGASVRPTPDRVREALFSILGDVDDFVVLDLFAGTGAISIEALSRGAKRALLVEKSRASLHAIERNIGTMDDLNAELLPRDVLSVLRRLDADSSRFDLIFADPPYAEAGVLLPKVLAHASTLLSPRGTIVFEHPSDLTAPEAPNGFSPTTTRRYGETSLTLYRREETTRVNDISLAPRLDQVAPSATLALGQKARELKAAGLDVVSLTAGEPDTPAAAHIIAAMKASLDRGETRYTAVGGVPELRSAIREDVKKTDGLDYGADAVVVSTGAKQAVYNALQALVGPGDEVIIPAPFWLSYRDMTHLAEAEPILVRTSQAAGFLLGPEQLEASITSKTRVLLLNSPCNPTGAAYREADLLALAEVLRKHPDLVVISDEIYRRFAYSPEDGKGLLSVAPDLTDRVVVINGCSKSYAMTGLRIGWALGPKRIISAMSKIQGQSTSNPCTTAQAGAIAAITGDQTWVSEMVDTFRVRRDLMVDRLNAIEGVSCFSPRGAFYVFPDVSGVRGGMTGAAFCEHMLDEYQLVMVPGAPFGAPEHVRLSFAVDTETIEKALGRIETAVASL